MKVCEVDLRSVSALSFSRYHNTEKLPREQADEYEKRTWREKCHVNEQGFLIIPANMIKNGLSESAKYLSVQIPGKGKATYTKHLQSGVMVVDSIVLTITKDEVEGEQLFLPSTGSSGGGSRVMRIFPLIREWKGTARFLIIDEIINKEVLIHHVQAMGSFIGFGRFRPRNNGFYGRFEPDAVRWDV
jgi:hypothetical protein